ncbi:hypothetical protein ACRALDRAFT_1073586 [Sodiomyces alcalophilus JCM 7366]|uniref:uncharacterized protein n=1 Tax=Sodiomyces alcalophilus JCM 7366 TaxID=591952 RepID=UPI0039B4895F
MSGTTIDDVVKRLSTPELDAKVRLEAATTLRDSLDHYTTGPIYTPFLKKLMPIFINILRGPCIFQSNSPEQKLRNCILEILHRLPTAYVPTEPFEPYAEEIVDLLMQLVRTDNEDNATLCVKVISDIMRHQHKVLGQKVQPFLSLIQDLFRQMDKVVREQLDNTSIPSNAAAGAPATPGSSQTNFQSPRPGSPVASATDLGPDPQQQNRMLIKGMSSFKVLSECPIIVVSLFPAYKNLVASNVAAFVPLIKGFLCLQASAQRQAHADAKARGDIFTGVSPLIKNRAAFGEFIAAQVKTMSFLAYLLRQHSQKLQDFLPTLPDIVVRLLKDCPREKSSTRKELLVAIRHIINFNFRKIFLPKIGELLDERTLIGDGLTVHETMRPLAYSMLADLIHHVRDQLTADQIRRTVEVYTKNLQDTYPGTSFQTMSAKLLLNMAECIARLPDKVDARHYLMMILSAIADKFEAMNRQYPNAVKLSKLYQQQTADGKVESYLADKDQPPDWDETDIFTAMPIKTSNPRERGADPVADNKFLFRNLMNGLKNTFYQLRGCNAVANVNLQNAPPQWQDVAYGFTAEEVKVIVKLFREGAYVFRYYETEKPSNEAQYTSPVEYMANFYMISSSKEEKDLLETFATVFHCIDPATFHEVFQQEIPYLYDMIFEHTGLLHIMQFFLASEATSPSFCGMLLRFLMDRIDQVGSADIKRSAILLRLFKLAFMAVTLFANQNEQVLLPHVVDIVTKSIELSTRAEEPMNYFFLLRSLFRSIGGGKFEHLYKQILPLLEMLLDVLNTLLMAARKPSERDLYVELCLTVPARLSNLLPHLSFLMRPLVVALRASTDLVGQGLRTLELCVDNLTADYLDPIMAPVIDELMTALFDHLRPHPYSHFHAHTTMRILGKLGGRNRKYITGPQPLDFKDFADDPTTFDVRLVGSKKDRALPAELGIDLAIRKLMETPRLSKGNHHSRQHDGYYKKQSFHYIKSQLKLRIGFDNLPDDLPRLLRLQAQDFLARKLDADLSAFQVSDRERSIPKKNQQDALVRSLLKAVMFAESLPDFKEEASSFLVNVARHFTIVEIGRSLVDAKHAYSQFNPNAGEGPLYISTRVLSDAIVESLSSEHPDVRDSAKRAIREIYNTATAIMGSTHAVARLPFVNNLSSTFCHACYEEEWFTKAGGTQGIHLLLTELNLGDQWAASKQTEFIRALMYVVKDMPQDLPEKTRSTAQVTLEALLHRVTKNIKKQDALPVPLPQGQSHHQHRNRLPQICMHFNSELSHMNRHVRETAKRSLELIAKAASCEVWELIAPYKDRFLQPIYSKPLRALPFPATIDAANDALKSVLQQTNKLPKDLLQGGLRPVLANLQDPKKLTCHGLDNLARLLKLLTTYFKVEIGARLLDHVKVLAEPTVLHLLSFTYFEQHTQMKVVAAVFNIFHLLPPAAETFKDRLIDLVLDLEEKLRRTQISPFRAPLCKYLNRYPAEMWAFLLPKLGELKYGRFLAQVLAHPDSGPLRSQAASAVDGLIQTCNALAAKDQGAKLVAIINTINMLHSLSQWPGSEGWLEKREVLAWLKQAGKELEGELRRYSIAPTLRLPASQALGQVMSIFLKSLEKNQKDLDSLLSLVEAVTAGDFQDAQPLISYIYRTIINSGSVDVWKAAVLKCLDAYSSKNVSQKMKCFLLHYIVNPIIAMDVQKNWNAPPHGTPRLMDRSVIDAVTTKIWKTHQDTSQDADDLSQPGIDHARFEVLQLSAMLVKYHHQTIQEARKDIIKSCWTFIRLDDVVNKHAAYVVIGYFIALYETPVKIVTQVYVSLLKTNQNEGRALVTQALELIAPVLPKRLGTAPNDRNAAWAVAPRRVLADEGLNIQQMTSTFNFLVRHPGLFYESRDKYAMLLITSLRKVAMPSNASQESKKLALNMMWLIWLWEQRRVEATGDAMARDVNMSLSPTARKRRLDGEQVTSSPPTTKQLPAGQNDYQIPPVGRLKMIRYLIEFIAQLNERYQLPSTKTKEPSPLNALPMPQPELYQRAMALLYNLLQPRYWADLDVDLFPHVTEAVLASDKTQAVLATDPADKDKSDDKFLTSVINTLQIVRIILHFKSDDWIQRNITPIQKVLDKCLKSEIPEVQDCLHVADPKFDGGRDVKPTIKRILDSVPEDVPMEDADAEADTEAQTSEFIQSLSTMAGEAMAAGNYTSGVNLLWSLGHRKPTVIDQHIPVLMKALQSKLAREHVQHYTIQASLQISPAVSRGSEASPPAGEMSADDLEISTTLMLRAMQTISSRMEVLGDHRRPFLSVLATLVEKSMHMTLCEEILSMVEGWVFRSEGTWPTLKEKTAVLHKMLSFEHRQDPTMLSKFLHLVIRIYEDPKIARTELTVRMEHAFLIGTRAQDVHMRNRFMAIFDKSLSKTATARFSYVLTSQNWDTLADSFWLAQASQLLLGGVELNTAAQLHHADFRIMPISRLCAVYAKDTREPSNMADDKYDALVAQHRRFMSEIADLKVRDFIEPLTQLQHADTSLAHQLWVTLFPLYWSATARDERTDLERGMVTLLTKDYHSRQIDKRPNVVQSLLEGAAKAWPDCKMPPHVLKYEAKTYDAWYTALVQLEKAAMKPEVESAKVRESNLDALVELYATLQEDDMFYGTWRRRCQFVETNAALSYEQNGMWDKAQKMYEAAQIKARTGVVPFSQGEYMIWEDHWVLCAQKLQQWDILQDFAKHENFQDLLLECAWRNTEMWQDSAQREALDTLIKGVMDAPTPRRAFFQAFMSLLKFYNKQESHVDFAKSCDEAIQLSIRKWHQLPQRLTRAHVPLLQNFQQLVELHDAQVICQSLAGTTQANLDVKSGELKLLLAAWRDRLPNVWDDITAWQDLVTWRQHIFGLINQTYLQLLPQQGSGQNTSGASFAYRGYHETAWIINRFAHVARKHNLPEVCISQLSRIYTLPNIEIQEAFLKLREQAKCHYENPDELTSGLDVINNTNLGYFNPPQKAEFYTLKGMFLEKLSQKEEADQAFGTALFFDITAAKAWAEWGYFNERKFKEDPTDLNSARQAVTSYLQAAGSYKNAKSRKLLSRILWLLSLDDANGTIAAGFDDFKGETPIWYWITFIPQLLTGLGHKEAPRVHQILTKIAKSYPQALYFQLRTNREDMAVIKKNQEAKERARQRAQSAASNGQPSAASPQLPRQDGGAAATPTAAATPGGGSRPGTAGGEMSTPTPGAVKTEPGATNAAGRGQKRPPWELTEEIMSHLKSAFPLLALSMETMVDQIQKNFKCPPDEDAYRLIVALLNDALAYVSRMPSSYAKIKLPPATETNIVRFADTILPAHIKKSFEADFVEVKPTMDEYIMKLRHWRNKFEEKLDRRQTRVNLEAFSPHLSEFRYQRFDDVEIPGQYLEHKDKNQDFIRIERFLPNVDLVRSINASYRRLRIRGHDASVHSWVVQHPAARHCRREERILQLFRQLNQTLNRRKESRRRDLQFTLPLMVPLAPHIRIVQEDTSYVALQGVYEDHCRRHGMSKDDPVLFTMEKLRGVLDTKNPKHGEQSATARLEVFNAIQEKWVPNTVALEYFQKILPDFSAFWLFRRQFSYQLATLTFMTYILYMHNRYPQKMNIARSSGNIWGSELMSFLSPNKPFFHNPEPVPFRLTPNLQMLMGPLAMEGIFSCALMATARCLLVPEHGLEHALTLFVRDEMIYWFTSSHRVVQMTEQQLRESVQLNTESIVKRAASLAQSPTSNLPANQTVIDLIAKAVNPMNLAQCDALWMPYL